MNVKTRIFLATGGLVAMLLLTSLYCVNRLQASLAVFEVQVQKAHHESDLASSMLIDFKIQVQEWKDVLLRGADSQKLETYWNNFQKRETRVAQTGQELLQSLGPGEARQLVEQFQQQHRTMGENYRKGLAAFKEAHFDSHAGDEAVAGMDRAPARLLLQFKELLARDSQSVADEASVAAARAVRTSLAVVGVLAILAVGVSFALSRSVIRPLEASLQTVRRVAEGDLQQEVLVDRQDEFGLLLSELRRMQLRLAELVGVVRAGSEAVAAASGEIAQGNQDLSQRTESQASALQQTAASMEELGATTRMNAEHARQANEMTQGASLVAARGGQVVSEVVETMHNIHDSSRKISDIIAVIDGIAFQTNILALNAAVEAARAGEQGRGFAVVAGEVRALAQRSATAAREIKALITESVERVRVGSELVGAAGATMNDVVDSIRKVESIVAEISDASAQQSEGVLQVGEAVTSMDQVTQQNAALVEEIAAAAASLRQQVQRLVQASAVFKLPPQAQAPFGMGSALPALTG